MAVSVSVIVPVYNAENYLEQCITSLLNQTLQDIEVIAVNDASTDSSLQILRKFESQYPEKMVVIDSKENLKAGGARNLGLDAACGAYVAFIDSDDWADLTMFEKLYLKARDTGADVADCDYYCYSGDDAPLLCATSNTQDQIGVLTDEIRKSLVLYSSRYWTKIIKRSLLLDNNIRYPEKLFYEDIAVLYFHCYIQRLEKVAEPLLYHRVNNHSMTRVTKKNHYPVFDCLTTARMLVENFKERGFYEKYFFEIEARFTHLYYMHTIPICLYGFDSPEKEYLSIMRSYMRENFKGYRRNPYYKRFTFTQRSMALLNDISPALLCKAYVILRAGWHFVTFRDE